MGGPEAGGAAIATNHDLGAHLKYLIWAWLQEPRNRVFIAICGTVLIIVLITCFCFHFVRSLMKYEYSGRHWQDRRELYIRNHITDVFFQELSHHALLTSVSQPCHGLLRRPAASQCASDVQMDCEEGSLLGLAPPPSYQEALSLSVEPDADSNHRVETAPSHVAEPVQSAVPLLPVLNDHDTDTEPPPSYESVAHITNREFASIPVSD